MCCPKTLRLQNSMQRTCCCAESSIHPEPFMFLFFSFSIKHQLKVSLSSCWLLLLLLCRKRSGRPRRARTDECRPLCGLRSPPVLAFRWRRERGGKKPSTLLLAEKNCSFRREFRTFIDRHLLFFNVCLAELIKEQGGAGKSVHYWFPLVELEIFWNYGLEGN